MTKKLLRLIFALAVGALAGAANAPTLTVHESLEDVHAALATGALGYVVKPRLGVDLGAAIKEVHAGRSYLSPSITPMD